MILQEAKDWIAAQAGKVDLEVVEDAKENEEDQTVYRLKGTNGFTDEQEASDGREAVSIIMNAIQNNEL